MTSSSSPATMDSSGFSQIGRYGTISLMKRQDPNAAVTAFGIDADQLTFGRDPTCGVRLYYADVSLVHCKIVFEEHKAFLVVLGANGLLVDGCKVYPNSSPSSSSSPTMIPLTNNSEFEIHGKRFRFTYPPKELRAALYASPARPANRALRLSLIQSTQVFSPRPSPDPRENLRILKSPLKNTFKSPYKSGLSTPFRTNLFSTSKYAYHSPVKPQPGTQPIMEGQEEDEEEDSIILVDGNHPRVVEEEKDLVILEDVEVPLQSLGSTRPEFYHAPQAYPAPLPPQTPVRNRSLSRNTLHRAVLIRSAQRAVLKAEKDEQERAEEEEEELEVLDVVASDLGGESDEEADDNVQGDEEHASAESGEEDGSEEAAEDEEEDTEENQAQKLTWRKSLERLWPFSSSSPGPKEEENGNEEDVDDSEEASECEGEEESKDVPAPLPPQQTPVRRPLGSFMTPQVHPRSKVPTATSNPMFNHPAAAGLPEVSHSAQGTVGAGRYSLGGGEARRVVRTEQVWKVRDIVVPEPPAAASTSNSQGTRAFAGPGVVGSGASVIASPARPNPRKVVNEEERKAIQERRRSALREVGTFFPGGAPGMSSPIKPLGWSPAKSSTASSSTTASSSSGLSPFKPSSMQIKREDGDEAEDAVDTRSLLEKMKETVEGMKRRRSLAPPATPARADPPVTPARTARMSFVVGPRPLSPSKAAAATMMNVPEEEDGEGGEKENVQHNGADNGEEHVLAAPAFSLLRPGVLEEVRAREGGVGVDRAAASPDEADSMDVVDDLVPQASVAPGEEPPAMNDVDVNDVNAGRIPLTSSSPAEDSLVDLTTDRTQRAKSKSKTPARRTKTKPAEDDHMLADNADVPAVPEVPKATARRGRKPARQPQESNDDPVPPAPPPAPTKRGRRAATAEPEDAPPAPTARRGRKATVEPEEESPTAEKAAPVKKGRKLAASAAPAENEVEVEAATNVAPPSKRGGRKAAAIMPVHEDTAEPVPRKGRTPKEASAGIPARKTAARSKNGDESPRGTTATPIEVGDEADPLDSIDAEEVVAAKPKGRKKVVKEGVDEGFEPAVAVPAKTRAKPTALKTPAVKARATKTPATAPPAVSQGLEKENTPSSEGTPHADGEEPVKVRVSRTTRKAASGTAHKRSTKVKREESDDEVVAEPEAPRGRVMRATRARTRT